MEFPSNTNKDREPREEKPLEGKIIDPVVTNGAERRKTPLGRRFMETFVGGDAKSVVSYMLNEIAYPAARNMIVDAVSGGIERMVFGEDRPASRRSGVRFGGGSSFVSYNKMTGKGDPRDREKPRGLSREARANHDFGEIVLNTRAEAEMVRERLYDLVNEFNLATVGDYLQLCGITPEYTDNKWGWDDMHGSSIRKIREGYLLDLPRTKPVE